MVPHFDRIIHTARLSPLRQRLVLAGTGNYHSRLRASWIRIAAGDVDQCIYKDTNGHHSCWQEPNASHWVARLEFFHERISSSQRIPPKAKPIAIGFDSAANLL
jgi:hypothetical protein